MKTNEERLEDLLSHLNSLGRIHVEDIPKIDLYMDQVTTFMESHLESMKRYPDDKVITKTMINNYAKNNLLPPPVRKKYTQEHILLLIFIYYFKNLLNFNDIETILSYITEHHVGETQVPLSRVYTEIFSMEHGQMDRLQEDVWEKFKTAQKNLYRYGGAGAGCPAAVCLYLRTGFRCLSEKADDRAAGRPDPGRKPTFQKEIKDQRKRTAKRACENESMFSQALFYPLLFIFPAGLFHTPVVQIPDHSHRFRNSATG